ncbi:MAG TPA: hypothetical protein VH877_12765 [Polyangia bacterium]|jgi:hypothetical protein|nr:hypothetical protein [Polyangia bacterium]
MMKWVLVGAAALAVGFVLGGYAPRTELEKTRQELAEARARLERGERERSAWTAGLRGLLAQRAAAPTVAAAPARVQAVQAQGSAAQREVPPEDDEEGPGDGGTSGDGGGERGRFDPKDPKAFETMRSAAELRAGQYRAAFVEAAHLDARKQQALDEIVRGMNAEVARESERLAATLAQGAGKLRTREMIDVGQALAQIYQRADDRLGQLLDPTEQAAARSTDFDLLTQVDLESVHRLFEVTTSRQEGAEAGAAGPR